MSNGKSALARSIRADHQAAEVGGRPGVVLQGVVVSRDGDPVLKARAADYAIAVHYPIGYVGEIAELLDLWGSRDELELVLLAAVALLEPEGSEGRLPPKVAIKAPCVSGRFLDVEDVIEAL